jgi:hypothetical protein
MTTNTKRAYKLRILVASFALFRFLFLIPCRGCCIVVFCMTDPSLLPRSFNQCVCVGGGGGGGGFLGNQV